LAGLFLSAGFIGKVKINAIDAVGTTGGDEVEECAN